VNVDEQASWISAASERQRRGRAGRCQPGVAFHLYSRVRSNGLADFQQPELHRIALDELCLQVETVATGHNPMLEAMAKCGVRLTSEIPKGARMQHNVKWERSVHVADTTNSFGYIESGLV
jgi:HrpA-like RNA helicase